MIKIFDSRDKFYKDPFGAVVKDERIHFKIVLPRYLACTKASLRVIADNNTSSKYLMMYWCGMYGDSHEMWECHFTPRDEGIYWYFFEIDTNTGKKQISKCNASSIGEIFDAASWQLTVSSKDFNTPTWLNQGIMYQIFPDRFYRSNKKKLNVPSDRTLINDWSADPVWQKNSSGEITNSDYFCGDLQGIIEKLDYLESLGVTCIYLNPIFEAHSNHRYNTADYSKIDPLLGTEEDFIKLTSELKRRNMHLILDGVFSHTGSDSVYFNKNKRYNNIGAYNSKDSEYISWYNFIHWPDKYNSWWGFDTLPEVKEENPNYNKYINSKDGIIRKWIKLGASGWRLDVADELPDSFIENLRKAAKAEDKDAIIIGEVWEDASNKESYNHRRKYLLGNELDSVMNYPFRNAILGFIQGNNTHDMMEIILSILENYPKPVIRILMNFLGTHDTQRAITVLAGEPLNSRDREWQSKTKLSNEQYAHGVKLMKIASAMLYTLPGVPCIYYGDEAGLEGYKDPFNRRCYPWGNENLELIDWYKNLARIRKDTKALSDGEFIALEANDGLMAYIRKDCNSSLLCAFNSSKEQKRLKLPVEFIELSPVLNTKVEDDYLIIESEACAFVKNKI